MSECVRGTQTYTRTFLAAVALAEPSSSVSGGGCGVSWVEDELAGRGSGSASAVVVVVVFAVVVFNVVVATATRLVDLSSLLLE